MQGSTWLPWLFFGPLLVAMASGIAYQFTRLPWLAMLAQLALGVLALVTVTAFIANYRRVLRSTGKPK